jgi:hypothetical protein
MKAVMSDVMDGWNMLYVGTA